MPHVKGSMKLLHVVGCRPNFIKAAPLLKAIKKHNFENPEDSIQEVLVHTGQHYDYEMSGVFFDDLGLKPPDYHLGVGSGTHAYQTGEALKRIEEVLIKEKPDVVIVYGDTNSTLAGALAAAKLHIPVAHVEAGLRSYKKTIPEEINRVLTDHISDFLFCPTETAVQNLKREGFTNIVNDGHLLPLDYAPRTPGDKPRTTRHVPLVLNVGDVMYDAVLQYAELAEAKSGILERLELEPRGYALATVHRAENTDDPVRLRGIFQGLAMFAQEGLTVVVPLHPRTRNALSSLSFIPEPLPRNLLIIEPVSYLDMLMLEKNARVILTDSGGMQKEAFFFRVPCVTLREETEWVETVEAGWNTLVGCDPERIAHAGLAAQRSASSPYPCSIPLPLRTPLPPATPYGDGRAAERMVSFLVQCFQRR